MRNFKSIGEWAVTANQSNKERDYWLTKLSGELNKVTFPYDSKTGTTVESSKKSLDIKFPKELSARLLKMSNESDPRLYMILVTGLVLLLHKYSSSSDIIIGAPVLKQELEDSFINTVLVLRNQIKNNITCKELLLQVKETLIEATDHQNYPIETLLYQLNMEAPGDDFPLFDVEILLENIHDKCYIEHIRFNMLFAFLRKEECVEGSIEYNPLLYKKATVERIGLHFTQLLETAVFNPDTPLSSLSVITQEEKQQVLFRFNHTKKEIARDKSYYHLFQEQVPKTPHKIAAVYKEGYITYDELNRKARGMMGYLLKKGAKPGDIIGLYLPRSIEILIAILGIFEAGCAYLPIDVELPENRVQHILERGEVGILISQSKQREVVSRTRETLPLLKHVFYFPPGNCREEDVENMLLQSQSQQPPGGKDRGGPDSLAYIIFTSGTTGEPKGVMIHQLGMINHLYAKIDHLAISRQDIIAQTASASFDISVWQFLAGLLKGGCTWIIDKHVVLDPGKFLETLQKGRITILESVPSLMTAFLDIVEHERDNELKYLRWMIPTGEALGVHLARKWYRCYPGIKLLNAYGPTEASDDVTHYVVDGVPAETETSIPIGKPLQNMHVYILDKNLGLCPVGVHGEICVAGIGVGKGYWKDREKTSRAFVTNPYGEEIKDPDYNVLYKTGDLGYFRSDGNIECLGRWDDQVKLRGNRIELGEIEKKLLEYPSIKETAVIVKDEGNGVKNLCAFVVTGSDEADTVGAEAGSPLPASEKSPDKARIKEYLSGYLPDYMIPSYIVRLDRLPLTPNGKIDRKVLQQYEVAEEEECISPRNEIEEKLVEIYKSVLGRDKVGINENFFMIGGDSIRSIQIISRLNKAGYKAEMRDLFQYPVISDLALRIKKTGQPLSQEVIIGEIPLTPVQREFFSKHQNQALSRHFNQAVMLLSRQGFDEAAVRAVFMELQKHHDGLRMTFKEKNGWMVQFNNGLDYPLSLAVYDFQEQQDGTNQLEDMANRIQASIDLGSGPLMKLGLFHLADGDRLLIVIHHLVIDGISWRILLEDIQTLYQQYNQGEALSLPLKTGSFKSWSEQLTQYANSASFLKEKAYWKSLESVEIPEPARDFALKDNYYGDVETLAFKLEESYTTGLIGKAHHAFGTDINDILLTGLGLGLKEAIGNERFLIALEGHGREELSDNDHINISRTVGWFTAVYPVLLDMSYAGDLGRQVKEIKESLHRIPQDGIGYGILKYLTAAENKKEIEFKLNPRIIFNYLGQVDAEVEQLSFEIAKESVGSHRSPKEQRDYWLEISGMIINKQILISVDYNKKHFKPGTIQAFLHHYEKGLKAIIDFCQSQEKRDLTPSDLTYKELPIERLEQLKREYELVDIYPLTPMQEGMLFHTLLADDPSVYFDQLSYRLRAKLDILYVEKSLNELFKRFDILRTRFVYEGLSRPLQVVLEKQEVDFYYEDIRDIGDGDSSRKDAYIKEFKQKDRLRSFDPARDVLMRVSVLQAKEAEYEFVWSFHHILMDGWCLGILIAEYLEIYNSYLDNRPYQLSEVKPYRSYIQWLEKQDREKSKKYWQEYLADYESLCMIGEKKAGETARGKGEYKNEHVVLELAGDILRQLTNFAGRNHVTLNTILQTTWGIMLGRYNNRQDVVFGAVVSGRPPGIEGVESMVGLFINTIPVRVSYEEKMNFSDLVRLVQEGAIASESHHHYPLAEVQSASALKQNLLDHILVFENYPIAQQIDGLMGKGGKKHNAAPMELSGVDVFEQSNYDFNLGIKVGETLTLDFNYNGSAYEEEKIKKIASHFKVVIDQIIENEEIKIEDITLLTVEEKKQILLDFNDTTIGYPAGKRIEELFEKEVRKRPSQRAVSSYLDLSDIFEKPAHEMITDKLAVKFKNCCFKKNPYIFKFENSTLAEELNFLPEEDRKELIIIKTHHLNYVAVNKTVLRILDYFNGTSNISSIFKGISAAGRQDVQFLIYNIEKDGEEKDFYGGSGERIAWQGNNDIDIEQIVSLVKRLWKSKLIDLVDYDWEPVDLNIQFHGDEKEISGKEEREGVVNEVGRAHGLDESKGEIKSPVLLLGDRTGQATTGLLYIASFLRKNGIEAYCQWNDLNINRALLRSNVEKMLAEIQPEVVGVSMKWFPHIARVLEICKIVKEYDPSIIVVVGGNTASYYCEKVIEYEWIDYVVRGDGEVPMLSLCLGDQEIPNSVYQEKGKIIKKPITYVQNESNTSGIFLSHLDEIFISPKDPYLASYFYINTGKGCSMSCLYCGGCKDAQKKTFNRDKPFMREVSEVRKDIIATKKYTSTFWFDFDMPAYDSFDYYRKIWEGVDLSQHFCEFYFWKLPSFGFLDYVVKVFKYVYINIDLCSLSEPHRLRLSDLGVVKPQPTDEELFSFFDQCATYDNIEVIINQITGLPLFSREDIEKSYEILSKLLNKYSCLRALDWGRLHAQPGAPIVNTCEQYDMHSYAKTFEDFLHFSRLNLEEENYPVLLTFNYPYIYSKDDELNSKISKFYVETNKLIEKHEEKKSKNFFVPLGWSYTRLDERANNLARVLRDKGVKPEVVVGIMMDRSMEMTAAILAILKAGGAYLPIDYNYPPERIQYMLADCNVGILLTQDNLSGICKEIDFKGEVINVSEDAFYLDRDKTNKPGKLSGANSLAYVLYTSGSTGKPKGVMVEHGNVVRLVKESNYIDWQPGDRLLLTGNIVFDLTTFEIWGPLLNGLTLYLVDQQVILDREALKNILSENRINILHLVPQLLSQVAPGGFDLFAGLKYLLVGGDLVRPRYINRLKKQFKDLEILHMYGPTENTTFSTFYPVEKEFERSIPIGKPLGNSLAYVVAGNNQLQPVGAAGELYVGGHGVARGYLNKPELTAEKFVEGVPGAGDRSRWGNNKKLLWGVQGGGFLEKSPPGSRRQKTYKTGDLAKWLPSGDLEFLGRRDHQVKIRGIRIELGEIEEWLLRHNQIKEAVVVVREGSAGIGNDSDPGNKYLCAYFVSDQEFSTSQLRNSMRGSLPEYMVPAYFIRLKQFPLTSNGKLDRQALPDPQLEGRSTHAPPRDPLEEKLVEIWSRVLGVKREEISIDSDFFHLGGHSLKAMILITEMHRKLNIRISLPDIFNSPTIRELVEYMKKERKYRFKSIEITEKKDYYMLSSAQKRLYILTRMNANTTTYNIPYFMELEGEIKKARIDETFKKIVDRHESFRTSFELLEGEPVQRIHDEVEFSIDYLDIDTLNAGHQVLAGNDVSDTILYKSLVVEKLIHDFVKPYDLSCTPLLRVGLIKVEQGKHVLMIDMHHIISDGTSIGIFVKEVLSFYTGKDLPGLRIQYKDFSEWFNGVLGSGEIKRQGEYWLNRFKDTAPVLNFPTDYARTSILNIDGDTFTFEINEPLTAKIRQMTAETKSTIYILLSAVYNVLLMKYTGQEDVVVGTGIAGRQHADSGNIIGLFVNMLALRNQPQKQKTFIEFLKEVKENAFHAYENQDYQFEELVKRLKFPVDSSRNPLFDTVFQLQNVDATDAAIPGLKIKSLGYNNKISHYDLIWLASEGVDQIIVSINYSTKLFKPSTIRRIANHYLEILEQVVEKPTVRLEDIVISYELLNIKSDFLDDDTADFEFKN